jgi:hypothetical protein
MTTEVKSNARLKGVANINIRPKSSQDYNFKLRDHQAFIEDCHKRLSNGGFPMIKCMISATICMIMLGAAAPAFSQSLSALPLRNPRQIPDGYISVQSGISLSIPMTDGDDEKQQQDAIKSFYRIAGSNCTALVETIADDCQISGLSSNTDVLNLDGRGPKLVVRGQVTMAVKLKAAPAAAK